MCERSAIEITLTVLVLASAVVGVEPGAIARTRRDVGLLAVVWATTTGALPPLAWVVSQVVPADDLRHAMLAAAVAPTEVDALAITSIVGGTVAAAALLVVSTVTSVVVAGPALSVLAGGADVGAPRVLVDLMKYSEG